MQSATQMLSVDIKDKLLTWRPLTSSWSQSRWMLRSPSCASFSRLEASLSFVLASYIFLSDSQLFWPTSKSSVTNFAFFAWNPFNLPMKVSWYHWDPQKGPFLSGTKNNKKKSSSQPKFSIGPGRPSQLVLKDGHFWPISFWPSFSTSWEVRIAEHCSPLGWK